MEKKQNLKIIQQADKKFILIIESITRPEDKRGEPFDLTGVTEIKCLMRKDLSIGGLLTKTLTDGSISVVEAKTGKIQVVLTEEDTGSLLVGECQSFEVEIHIGPDTYIVQFVEQLDVVARIFG